MTEKELVWELSNKTPFEVLEIIKIRIWRDECHVCSRGDGMPKTCGGCFWYELRIYIKERTNNG